MDHISSRVSSVIWHTAATKGRIRCLHLMFLYHQLKSESPGQSRNGSYFSCPNLRALLCPREPSINSGTDGAEHGAAPGRSLAPLQWKHQHPITELVPKVLHLLFMGFFSCSRECLFAFYCEEQFYHIKLHYHPKGGWRLVRHKWQNEFKENKQQFSALAENLDFSYL